jgi:hypothetical protein
MDQNKSFTVEEYKLGFDSEARQRFLSLFLQFAFCLLISFFLPSAYS